MHGRIGWRAEPISAEEVAARATGFGHSNLETPGPGGKARVKEEMSKVTKRRLEPNMEGARDMEG